MQHEQIQPDDVVEIASVLSEASAVAPQGVNSRERQRHHNPAPHSPTALTYESRHTSQVESLIVERDSRNDGNSRDSGGNSGLTPSLRISVELRKKHLAHQRNIEKQLCRKQNKRVFAHKDKRWDGDYHNAKSEALQQ